MRWIEVGLGYNFSRNVVGKLVGQFNDYINGDELDSDIIAFSLTVNMR